MYDNPISYDPVMDKPLPLLPLPKGAGKPIVFVVSLPPVAALDVGQQQQRGGGELHGRPESDSESLEVAFDLGTWPGRRQQRISSASTVLSHSDVTQGFPEGGWRAWATVAGAILLQFCGFGYSTSYGVYQDYYSRVYLTNSSPSTISWIGSVNTFLVIATGLVAGRLYDRGYFYHLIIGGSLLISASLFLLSLAKPNNLYQCFLAQGVGLGLGGGLVYVPSVAVVSQYFRRRLASVMMFAVSGSALGAIVHPIMLNALFNHHHHHIDSNGDGAPVGFAAAVRASAALVSGMLLLACLLIRTRLPPPESLPDLGELFRKSASEVPFVVVSASLFVFSIGFFFPIFYLQMDASHHGLSKEFSFYALVLLNGSSFLGRLVPGLFVRSLGVLNAVVIASTVSAVMVFAMIGLGSMASVVVIAILCGFSLGMFISLQAPLVAVLTANPAELGARMGIAFTFSALGALLGPPINGALLSSNYVWWRPAVFSGVNALVGASGFAWTAYDQHRRKKASTVAPEQSGKENLDRSGSPTATSPIAIVVEQWDSKS